jgi:hypothetical protein
MLAKNSSVIGLTFLVQHSDFREEGSSKPPYSYAALICLAMLHSGNKMTLAQIYK